MKKIICILFFVLSILQLSAAGKLKSSINRKALVDRHRIVTTQTDPKSPAQVGNGEFAFGVDITGLQTFVPFNTMAQWSWHSSPLPQGVKAEDYKQVPIDTYGRPVLHDIPNPQQPELSAWLAGNPHRFSLGRIGFKLTKSDGSAATATDLTNTRQEVDMWTGTIYSRFELEGIPVSVTTTCHPTQDAIGITVESPLLKKGQVVVFLDFPYPVTDFSADYVSDFNKPTQHKSALKKQTTSSALIERTVDEAHYYTALQWNTSAHLATVGKAKPHCFELTPIETDKLAFSCLFSKQENLTIASATEIREESAIAWEKFWQSGAAIDLSESSDPRWKELERRIILSQYVMRMNEAGSLPPQESGLLNNGWYGRFHFEMIWWHGVHYALWNRWDLFDKGLHVYRDFLPTSRERAKKQGYKGARWPKCTADFDREWPQIIHATLIWQQPHPIYFAELDYRQHPTKETLNKWKNIVFASADFMADFAHYDTQNDRYVLGPPVHIVSENTDPMTTINPAFELGYWRFGLRVAQEWRKRLSMPVETSWKKVADKLSPLPVQDDLYITCENMPEMWKKYAFEHPALIGTYGMLPGDGVDKAIFQNTISKVSNCWNFDRTWGWDFPMLAMASARTGRTNQAIAFLLHPADGFQFDKHGLATGGPFPYFPSNGALLTAVAMMAGGWDGSKGDAPGFPKDGSWVVRAEGFMPMP